MNTATLARLVILGSTLRGAEPSLRFPKLEFVPPPLSLQEITKQPSAAVAFLIGISAFANVPAEHSRVSVSDATKWFRDRWLPRRDPDVVNLLRLFKGQDQPPKITEIERILGPADSDHGGAWMFCAYHLSDFSTVYVGSVDGVGADWIVHMGAKQETIWGSPARAARY